MSEPYELEHWRSRALVAEKEREAARPVLASLRGYFRAAQENDPSASSKLELVRGYLSVHDQTYWTRHHAMRTVAEAIAFGLEDEPSDTSCGGQKDV